MKANEELENLNEELEAALGAEDPNRERHAFGLMQISYDEMYENSNEEKQRVELTISAVGFAFGGDGETIKAAKLDALNNIERWLFDGLRLVRAAKKENA